MAPVDGVVEGSAAGPGDRAHRRRGSRARSRAGQHRFGWKELRPGGGELDAPGADRRAAGRSRRSPGHCPRSARKRGLPPRPAARTVRPPGSVPAREMAGWRSGTVNGGTGILVLAVDAAALSGWSRAPSDVPSPRAARPIERRGVEHMLEVVEHQQRRRRDRVAHVSSATRRPSVFRRLAQPQPSGQCRSAPRRRRRAARAEACIRRPGTLGLDLWRPLKRQPGLAAAARAGERQQTHRVVPTTVAVTTAQFLLATDERCSGRRQPWRLARSAWE